MGCLAWCVVERRGSVCVCTNIIHHKFPKEDTGEPFKLCIFRSLGLFPTPTPFSFFGNDVIGMYVRKWVTVRVGSTVAAGERSSLFT